MRNQATTMTRPGAALRSAIAAVVLAVAVVPAAAQTSPTRETLEAADRLIAAQDIDKMLSDVGLAVSMSLPENLRAAYTRELGDPGFRSRLSAEMRRAMAMHFTAEELNALADFYSKPVAKSAMAKMGPYMGEVLPFMQREMVAMAKKLQVPQ